MSVRWNRSAQPSPTAAFRAAMNTNPQLRVMVVSGIFDLVSSYYAIEQAASQLPADLAERVVVRTYAGGHAIYTDDAVRHQLRLDAAKFFQQGISK
jgi:carboxypeptidase C (cathepsin A)